MHDVGSRVIEKAYLAGDHHSDEQLCFGHFMFDNSEHYSDMP
jgi:hypothetical protein